MTLNCFVIDDEPHAIELLSDYIDKTPAVTLAGAATNPVEGFHAINEFPEEIAVTFVDIDMPELSGLDLAALISSRTAVVFTTSYREYGPEAYERNAVDYLLKPISYERFITCVQKLRNTQAAPDAFFVKSDIKGKMIKVPIVEIRYISSLDNYAEIHLEKEKVVAYLTLNELDAFLPSGDFSRIQKSLIVAHRYIRSVEHFQVKLQNQTSLPVGKVYSAAFLAKLYPALLVSGRKSQKGGTSSDR